MAIHEEDREDLFAEVTAYELRGELHYPGLNDSLVVGFQQGERTAGCFGCYWGADPVYVFDADFRLRRAFVEGNLYRTQGQTLAQLKRVRIPGETTLLRHDLSGDELEQFRLRLQDKIQDLALQLQTGAVELRRIQGSAEELRMRLQQTCLIILSQTEKTGACFLAPRIPGKR